MWIEAFLAYLIFPHLFLNFFRIKLLLYSGLLSHKQSVIVLIHSRLIVNTQKNEINSLRAVIFMIRVDRLDEKIS